MVTIAPLIVLAQEKELPNIFLLIKINILNFAAMKNKLITLLLALLTTAFLPAQITVSSGDLVSAGSIVPISQAIPDPSLDISTTGANAVWDFSTLTFTSQQPDTFLSISSTALTYFAYFNLPSHKSNIAHVGPNFPSMPGSPVTVSNVYSFFNKTSSKYEQTGFGAEVDGLPTAIGFDKNDIIYRLPLQFGGRDSSNSNYNISLPGVGYYGHVQTRNNHCDGWGTITTPYGTFPALRIVSEVQGRDSAYSASYGLGFPFPPTTTREYKWLGNGHKVPLLQINTEVTGPNESIVSVSYLDNVHTAPNSISETQQSAFHFTVYPNPTERSFQINLSAEINHPIMTLSDLTGRIVQQKQLTNHTEPINVSDLAPGLYFIRLQSGEQSAIKRIIIK